MLMIPRKKKRKKKGHMFKNSLGKPTRRNPSITQSKNIGMISTSNSQILKLRTHNNLIYLRNEKINK